MAVQIALEKWVDTLEDYMKELAHQVWRTEIAVQSLAEEMKDFKDEMRNDLKACKKAMQEDLKAYREERRRERRAFQRIPRQGNRAHFGKSSDGRRRLGLCDRKQGLRHGPQGVGLHGYFEF